MTTAMSPPTSDHKPKQFAFVLTEAELKMLGDLAEKDEMSKAHFLRFLIRSKYLDEFENKRPGAEIPVTLRALVGELSGATHYTIRNIADRMAIVPARLVHYVERVSIKTKGKILTTVDGSGPGATWELLVSREKALAAIEAAGFDLDEPLVVVNPDGEK